jgi:uncharacterized protein involved in exopolysaccharide biosynthesis
MLMRNVSDSFDISPPSVGSYYMEVMRSTLAILWRRKLLFATILAVALFLGIIAVLVLPKQYTSESYIHAGLTIRVGQTVPDSLSGGQERSGATIGFDALQLVETQSRLLQSHQFARLVVERLGLERLQSDAVESPLSAWLRAKFYGNIVGNSEYQKDEAATRLLSGLSVRTEPRVYMIVVSYTAKDPTFAALVVNTFVAEFLRTIELQKLSEQRASAQAILSKTVTTFGDKHPRVTGAQMRLAVADDLLRSALSKKPEEFIQASAEKVTFAQADAVPTSPNPKAVFAISLLAGLITGVALALYLPGVGQGRTRS